MRKKDTKANAKRKGTFWGMAVIMLIYMLVGAGCGFAMFWNVDTASSLLTSQWEWLLMLLVFVYLYLAFFVHIVLHEAGHLLAGIASGYRFSSFRIGSLMWILQDGKLRLRRQSIVGTGGQCIMSPPEGESVPFLLYNLGGVLMNAATSLLALGLFWLLRDVPFLASFLLSFALVGFGTALVNGIPLNLPQVNNDGSNAVQLGKSPRALNAFVTQLRITEQSMRGVRIKDMPEAWFAMPDAEDMDNALIASIAVYRENRLMDMGAFDEARALVDKLLNEPSAIPGLYRSLLQCDRLYLALLDGQRGEAIEALHDKPLRKFMKQMRTFTTVIRTQYACALLADNDEKEAQRQLQLMERCAKRSPSPADVEGERELMDIARRAAEGR